MGIRSDRRRDERGATTAELVIAFPVVLMMILLIIQFALVAHAQSVAEAAAQEGVAAAREFDGTDEEGRATAQTFLDELGGRLIQSDSVTVSRSAETVTVTVTGTVVSVLPGFGLTVDGTSTGPIERYVPPEQP